MEIIIRKRGGGKTTELIRRAHNKPDHYIVCQSPIIASDLERMALREGFNIKAVSVHDIKSLRGQGTMPKLLLDNAEGILVDFIKAENAYVELDCFTISAGGERQEGLDNKLDLKI